MILYIHGFLSSSKSLKALQTVEYMAQHFPETEVLVPQLPANPTKAVTLLENIFKENQPVIKGIIGSSLGGYYGTYLAEKYSVKSVLVNPAVRPYELFRDFMGPQTNPYTNEQFDVDDAYLSALEAFDTGSIKRPDCYWLLQKQGDEVLDYRRAVSCYQGAKQTVDPGGDHAFSGFDAYLPQVAEFFAL